MASDNGLEPDRERNPLRVKRVTMSILVAIFSINFMDRQILAILAEPIKRDLALSDTEVGLLYGLAFAALYATAAIPIARYADHANRARIINWSLVLFSLMSMACGLAANYWQLIAARVGVAIGEGGTNPPSHSMITDLYPVSRRSTAMAVFSLGPHIGLLLGFLIGGWVGQLWGWRTAFLFAGLGGLAFAAPSFMLLGERRRDRSDGVEAVRPVSVIFRTVMTQASTRHLFLGATVFSVAAYSVIGWLPSLLIRDGGFGTGAAGTVLALVLGLAGAVGTMLGGTLADRLGKDDPAWRLKVVAVVLLLLAPAWAAVFLATHSATMLAFLLLPGALLGFYLGPTFAMVQSLTKTDIEGDGRGAFPLPRQRGRAGTRTACGRGYERRLVADCWTGFSASGAAGRSTPLPLGGIPLLRRLAHHTRGSPRH